MSNTKDLTNEVFGMLTVVKGLGDGIWLCECSCGNQNLVRMTTRQLKIRANPNCGCAERLEIYKENNPFTYADNNTTIVYAFNTGTKFYIDSVVYDSIKENNKTGHTGVSLYGKNKYRAQICVNGKNIVLGVRSKLEDAIQLRKEAEIIYFGETK